MYYLYVYYNVVIEGNYELYRFFNPLSCHGVTRFV